MTNDQVLGPDPTTARAGRVQPAPDVRSTEWFDHHGYPFESRYLELPQGRLHYVDEGQGSAIVFVHGTPSWSYDMRKLISGLRSRHRCIAPDHLGFGLSDRPEAFDYSLASHTQNLRLLLEALGVGRFTLVVHDFGGPIALPLALERPERLEALVVLNSWAWSMAEDPGFERVRRFAQSPIMRFLYLYLNFSAKVLVRSAWGKERPLTAQAHRHFTALFPNRASRLGTWAFAKALGREDTSFDPLASRLGALAGVPSAVLWGMADGFVGAPHLSRWKRELPQARFIELDGVGHFPQDEAGERVLAELDEFIARAGLGGRASA